MNKIRLWVGERLHILADKVLPIPSYAKGGAYTISKGKVISVNSARIVEGRYIYQRMTHHGIDIEQAKDLVIAEARNAVLADIAHNALPMIEYSIIKHGTRNRVYYEVMGRLFVMKYKHIAGM